MKTSTMTELAVFLSKNNTLSLDSQCDLRIEDREINKLVVGNSKIVNSVYYNIDFNDCEIYGTEFQACVFENCTFNNCKLEFSHFRHCEFVDCIFTNCEIACSSALNSTAFNCKGFSLLENKENIFELKLVLPLAA